MTDQEQQAQATSGFPTAQEIAKEVLAEVQKQQQECYGAAKEQLARQAQYNQCPPIPKRVAITKYKNGYMLESCATIGSFDSEVFTDLDAASARLKELLADNPVAAAA